MIERRKRGTEGGLKEGQRKNGRKGTGWKKGRIEGRKGGGETRSTEEMD